MITINLAEQLVNKITYKAEKAKMDKLILTTREIARAAANMAESAVANGQAEKVKVLCSEIVSFYRFIDDSYMTCNSRDNTFFSGEEEND